MLTGRTNNPSEAPVPLRVCTISDGIDALLRLAGYIAVLPAIGLREDLTLAAAMDRLKALDPTAFDLIVIAPDAEKEATPRLVEAIVAEARLHSPLVVIALPPRSRFRLAPMQGVRVVQGPPFEGALVAGEASALASEAEPAPSQPAKRPLWKRVVLGRTAKSAAAVPPATPTVPSLPKIIQTLAVQPLSGGSGATCLAVNLAAELARADSKLRVCLLDFNLQFGNVATYLNLPSNSRVLDAYRSMATLDADAFEHCLLRNPKPVENLRIFPAPDEILPIDGLTSTDLGRIVALARASADLVILDLPHLIADWSEAAFRESDIVLAVALLDVRSAQNAARLRDLLRSETLTRAKLLYLLNRVPRKPSALWQEERKEFEKAAGSAFFWQLPDGGEEPSAAMNRGLPLYDQAASNPFRLRIRDLARVVLQHTARQDLSVEGGS